VSLLPPVDNAGGQEFPPINFYQAQTRLSVSYVLRDYGPSFDILLTPMTTFESCSFEGLSARLRSLRA